MKKITAFSPWITLTAFIFLIICCNIPWAYYPDLEKSFTGFYTEKNVYGKPAKFLLTLAALSTISSLIPKLFFKRLNIFISALNLAYSIKIYITYAACYHGICPEKRLGLYLVVILSAVLMLTSLFPKGNINSKK